MAAKKKGLGRGLNTLIPSVPIENDNVKKTVKQKEESETVSEKGEIQLSINKIEPNPDQPRNQFDEDSLQELADSIKQYGVLQPLLVKK
ncbi:ParB N-terminal domain-containing protein, partial [Anaerostipes sp.]